MKVNETCHSEARQYRARNLLVLPGKAALAGQVGSKRKSENALTELHFTLALAKTCCGTIVL